MEEIKVVKGFQTALSRKDKLAGKRLSCQVKDNLKIKLPESIFGIKKVNATVISNRNVATFIKELVLKPETPIDFKAGAYFQIDVPEYVLTFKDFHIDSRFVSEWEKYNLLELTAKGIKPGLFTITSVILTSAFMKIRQKLNIISAVLPP